MLNPEHVLVPYQAGELPPGPWLVFAPHADDETFGMGGSLLKAGAAGIATHVIVVTDGSLGGSGEDLVATRHSEVRQACELLGVSSLQCWQEQDRGLAVSPPLVGKTRQAIEAIGAASVFFPGPLELHPDHRNTAALVWAALQGMTNPPTAFAYEISVQSPINLLVDITAEMPAKQQAMQVYVSQNGLNSYPELIVALNKTRTFTLPEQVSHAEGFCRYDRDELRGSLRQATEKRLALYW